ncbi:hypothetical protein KP509_21G058600 [Ceratopteris richardii]|uniref:HAT C-terminal dimerisation domain-containing protein n=1 Tax=Ceratopteris richardii TaxID=49495 RepID=A0A8T2SAU0_CERRI|nr:hypothetical protein KP509_21G058600 [Ceratopteris richardii]
MPRGISPLWGIHTIHNELVKTTSSGSATRRWIGKYCGKQFSTTTTRLIRHVSGLGGSGISGCTKVPQDIAEIVCKEHKLSQDDAMARRREFLAASQDILEEVEEIGHSASTLKSRISSQRDENECSNPSGEHSSQIFKASHSSLHSTYLSIGLQKQRQRVVDIEIEQRRCILECNIPFNVVRTDAWKRMVKAIAQVGPSDDWHGVDYKRLRTSMLTEEKRIENLLKPIKLGDIRQRHIINIMVSSCWGTYFLKAIDCSHAGTRITGEFIFEHIKASIEEIATRYERSNVAKLQTVRNALPCNYAPVVSDARKVISFICKNHQALAIFRAYSEKELIRPAETRFGYIYHVFARLHVCMDALRMTVVDPRWRSLARGRTERANFVQRKIFDMDFWVEIERIMPILRPIHTVLRFVDMEGSTLGLLYHMYTRMQEAISSVTTLSTSSPCERNWSAFSLVHTKLRNRSSVEQLHRVDFCKANL